MTTGIKIEDLVVGTGREAEKDLTVVVRYDGYLNRGDCFQRGVEYSWTVGRREVIAGLDAGVVGMRVGGRRRITVSPHLGYRDKGLPGTIPPNAVLVFDVELLNVQDASVRPKVGRDLVEAPEGRRPKSYADYCAERKKAADPGKEQELS